MLLVRGVWGSGLGGVRDGREARGWIESRFSIVKEEVGESREGKSVEGDCMGKEGDAGVIGEVVRAEV